MFAAFALVFAGAAKPDVSPEFRPYFLWVMMLIAAVGIFTSTIIQKSIHYAEVQHELLRQWWMRKYGDEDLKLKGENKDRHPPISGKVPKLMHSGFAPSVLPFVFIVAWLSGIVLAAAMFGLLTIAAAIRVGYILLLIVAVGGVFASGIVLGRSGRILSRRQSGGGT